MPLVEIICREGAEITGISQKTAENPVNYFYIDLTPDEYGAMIQQAEDAGDVLD